MGNLNCKVPSNVYAYLAEFSNIEKEKWDASPSTILSLDHQETDRTAREAKAVEARKAARKAARDNSPSVEQHASSPADSDSFFYSPADSDFFFIKTSDEYYGMSDADRFAHDT